MFKSTSILEEEHIFIHSLLGRTGSTALQRLLNSSGQITVWGEPWGLIARVLDFANFMDQRRIRLKDSHQHEQYKILVESTKSGVHNKFYPNAFRPLDDSIRMIDHLIVELLKSPDRKVRRFGYKDITNFKLVFINQLMSKFPNAHIVFMIRRPIDQWISVRSTGFFNYDLDFFIKTYNELGYTILSLKKRHPCFPIIDKEWLLDEKVVARLFKSLSISKFDKKLIGKTVSSFPPIQLEERERTYIEQSGVNTIYERLLEKSIEDYNRIMS